MCMVMIVAVMCMVMIVVVVRMVMTVVILFSLPSSMIKTRQYVNKGQLADQHSVISETFHVQARLLLITS